MFPEPSKLALPVTASVIDIVLAVKSFDAVDAFPVRLAVIVPAEKSPLTPRLTIMY